MSSRVMELIAMPDEDLDFIVEDDVLFFNELLESEDERCDIHSLEDTWAVIWFILTDSSFDANESYAPSIKVYDEEGDFEISTSFLSEAEFIEDQDDDGAWSECYYLSAGEVLLISRALNVFSVEDFTKRLRSTIFKQAVSNKEIYRGVFWSKEENYPLLIDSYYKPFVEFFSNAASQGKAIIYGIG